MMKNTSQFVDQSSRPTSRRARIEALLGSALADSFPASDPIAITVDHEVHHQILERKSRGKVALNLVRR